MIAERRAGDVFGPVALWTYALNEDGRLRDADTSRSMSWQLPGAIEEGMPESIAEDLGQAFVSMFVPALLAVSFMHCKNVDIRPVDPPERLSRKYERKRGRPLSRYYVLDIEPMRRILESEGDAQTKGLKHALHVCRGHFKTFSEETPLFGKYSGTYWWSAHVRGSADEGVVDKDYRIRVDASSLGREYVPVDEHREIAPNAPEHTGVDPDLGGRGLRAHAATQNMLAEAVEAAGFRPRRPKPDEPQYDLAWQTDEGIRVAEVKSLTARNEERQLRIALGQVMRYRQLLARGGHAVRAMIVCEHEPSDPSWRNLCAEESIVLGWPGRLEIWSR